jgi:hypothetical protein
MARNEREEERRVMDIAATQWDAAPYSVALEIKRFLANQTDEGTSIDSGTGLLWPQGAPEPIEGHAEADLHAKIGGVEFYITVRKSNAQLLTEGVTREQLGLPPLGDVGIQTPSA